MKLVRIVILFIKIEALTLIKLKNILNKVKIIILYYLNNVEGEEMMAIEVVPEWMTNLADEDITFIKRFLLASGSLKDIASQYGVTYPTVRLRLDKLIQKIKINEDNTNDHYISLIKRLALNEKIDFNTAKILISQYKKMKKEDD